MTRRDGTSRVSPGAGAPGETARVNLVRSPQLDCAGKALVLGRGPYEHLEVSFGSDPTFVLLIPVRELTPIDGDVDSLGLSRPQRDPVPATKHSCRSRGRGRQ